MKNRKNVVVAAIVLVVLVVAGVLLYHNFGPKTNQGSKQISVTVVYEDGTTDEYQTRTDAEYLLEALREIDGLTIDGTEDEYGLYVQTVNGVTADYDTDGAYWSFYVNDEYCNYGVGEQPVADGDAFTIKYEVWTE